MWSDEAVTERQVYGSTSYLRQQADTALAAHKHLEAIMLYQPLAKAGGKRSAWELRLIDAYGSRAGVSGQGGAL